MDLEEYYNKLVKVNSNTHDHQVEHFLKLFRDDIPFAFARFNDGEMMGIDKIGAVAARGDQPVNESLHNALKEALQHKQLSYFVGLPCKICFPKYAELAKKLVKQPTDYHYNAVALTNRNWAMFIKEFPRVIRDKKILWISGDDQNILFLKEMGLNIVGHLKYKAKNSWDVYHKIVEDFRMLNSESYDIVMISLGPTARVFVKEMFERDNTKTFIDIGSTFDPFTRNVWHNCHKGWLENGRNNTKDCKICN